MKETGRIVIHKATAEDLPKIVRHMEPTGKTPLYPFTDLAKLQNIPLDGLIVAEVQGEYAGFLYWYRGEEDAWLRQGEAPGDDPAVKNYGNIEEVQVLTAFQRQGVGRKMLGYALEEMKGRGVKEVYLVAREGNTSAQGLYDSVGFRPFSRHIRYKLNLG